MHRSTLPRLCRPPTARRFRRFRQLTKDVLKHWEVAYFLASALGSYLWTQIYDTESRQFGLSPWLFFQKIDQNTQLKNHDCELSVWKQVCTVTTWPVVSDTQCFSANVAVISGLQYLEFLNIQSLHSCRKLPHCLPPGLCLIAIVALMLLFCNSFVLLLKFW